MFVPFYKHPLFNLEERENCRKRWTDPKTGQKAASHQRVLALINQGAREDFLSDAFNNHELPVLDDCYDLRGFSFWQIVQDFAREGMGDHFKGINFKHSEFCDCHFKNAVFYSSSLEFVSLYNCTFEGCFFGFTRFLGAKIEKSNFIACDFAEACSFENVQILNSEFRACFLGEGTPFRECYFDDLTSVQDMKMCSYHFDKVITSKAALAGYYASFQSAYEASGSDELTLEYFYKGRQAFTWHNSKGWEKVVGMAIGLLTGYGLRPARPIIAMLLLYAIATWGYAVFMPLKESITFTGGALFTFGAGSEQMKDFGCLARIIYVALSFSGIVLSALFVTTLANLCFRQKIPIRTLKPR